MNNKTIQIIQLAKSIFQERFSEISVLDLGCMEGTITAEFAKAGVKSIEGVEAQEVNYKRAVKLQKELKLSNLKFLKADVRDLSLIEVLQEKQYDMIIMSGLLYHLDEGYGLRLLEKVGEMCSELLFLSTHTTTTPNYRIKYNNVAYEGLRASDRRKDPEQDIEWMGLDEKAVHYTKESLLKMLTNFGFKAVFEILHPISKIGDKRLILGALK